MRIQLGAGDAPPARYPGVVAADEAGAGRAARRILEAGGTAADAAVTLALSLAVTLPAAAGLGGGGVCVVHGADGASEILDFTSAPASQSAAARFQAAVPALPRGMLALHAKHGRLPWAQVVAPAETLARFGFPVSQALAKALESEGGVLANDGTALSAFMSKQRQTYRSGDTALYADLAATLGRLRARGSGDFYDRALAQEIEVATAAAGANLTRADLRAWTPRWQAVAPREAGAVRLYETRDIAATSAAATTGFVIADAKGAAVACVLTMGKPFGLGVMPKGVGFLLAPASAPAGAAPLRASIGTAPAHGALVSANTGGEPESNMLICTRAENATSPACTARGSGYAEVFELKEE